MPPQPPPPNFNQQNQQIPIFNNQQIPNFNNQQNLMPNFNQQNQMMNFEQQNQMNNFNPAQMANFNQQQQMQQIQQMPNYNNQPVIPPIPISSYNPSLPPQAPSRLKTTGYKDPNLLNTRQTPSNTNNQSEQPLNSFRQENKSVAKLMDLSPATYDMM